MVKCMSLRVGGPTFCSSGSHVLVILICNFVDWRCFFDEEVKRFVNDVIPFELIQMCVP